MEKVYPNRCVDESPKHQHNSGEGSPLPYHDESSNDFVAFVGAFVFNLSCESHPYATL